MLTYIFFEKQNPNKSISYKTIQVTFSLNEKQTAPNAGNSCTSGLKINLKTPVNPIFFTYINKLPAERKKRIIRNNLK